MSREKIARQEGHQFLTIQNVLGSNRKLSPPLPRSSLRTEFNMAGLEDPTHANLVWRSPHLSVLFFV
jgi:hypothetical protein